MDVEFSPQRCFASLFKPNRGERKEFVNHKASPSYQVGRGLWSLIVGYGSSLQSTRGKDCAPTLTPTRTRQVLNLYPKQFPPNGAFSGSS